MKNCPCCSNQLLRHIRGKSIYWFCRSCRQEMSVLESKARQPQTFPHSLSTTEVFQTRSL